MGPRRLIAPTLLAVAAACGPPPAPPQPPPSPPVPPSEMAAVPPAEPPTMSERVVADFEAAVNTSRDAYLALFDFAAVGEMEILLHRYDLLGRLTLPDDIKGQFAAEDGTPYPAERERTNVGGFYRVLAQRTVGTGGCVAREPVTRYGKLLATYGPLPEGTPPAYEALRTKANDYIARGGLVALRCRGGSGGIALVWTARTSERGYELITIYDD